MSDSDLETPEAEIAAPETRLDEDDRLKPEYVREVMARVEAGDAEGARALVEPLHPADVADLFELVDSGDRRALAAALADLLDGDVLAEMNDWVREELLDALEPHEVAEIAGELETDDAVALIEDMEEEEQRAVLRALDPDDRAAIEEALSYPEDTAGRLMRRDAVAVPEHWTVGHIIDFLRAERGDGDRFLGGVRRRSGAPAGRHLPALLDPEDAAADPGRRRDEARADPDPGRDGPGGGRAPLPEICPDLGGGGRSGRSPGRHDHRRRRRPHRPGGSGRGRVAALRRGRRGRHQRAGARQLQGAGALAGGEPAHRFGRLDDHLSCSARRSRRWSRWRC